MDDLTLASDALRQNLEELETINTWLGGYGPVLNALDRLRTDFRRPAPAPCRLGQWRRRHPALRCPLGPRHRLPVELTGIDANQFMLDYAAEKSQEYPEISFQQHDIFAPEFRAQPFDVITCSLFCHHFTDDELVRCCGSGSSRRWLAVIINDLHRHPVAYHSIKWLTRLLRRLLPGAHDAPLSVARAFRRDWQRCCAQAGIAKYELRWRWAFRWQVVIARRIAALRFRSPCLEIRPHPKRIGVGFHNVGDALGIAAAHAHHHRQLVAVAEAEHQLVALAAALAGEGQVAQLVGGQHINARQVKHEIGLHLVQQARQGIGEQLR